jgi:hypothetical protein
MVYLASFSGTIYSYTVSGTTLTASTTYAFTSSSGSNFDIFYLSAKKVLIMMGNNGIVETYYFNTTAGAYVEDTIFTISIPLSFSPEFGSMFYLKANQRFGFYQSSFVAMNCPIDYYYDAHLTILDIPTTNFYIAGTTTTPYKLGISSATYSNGNTASINYFAGGSIYTHSSSPFTIGLTYYKKYDNTFTTTSTGAFSNAGVAVATNKLIISPTPTTLTN